MFQSPAPHQTRTIATVVTGLILGVLGALGPQAAHAALPDPLADVAFVPSAFAVDTATLRPRSSTTPSVTITMAPDCPAGVETTTSASQQPTPCNITSGFGSDADGDYLFWTAPDGTGGGFTLTTNSVIGETYTIAMRFKVVGGQGFEKIIDFKNRTEDAGFYLLNGEILFYPGSSTSPTFGPTDIVDLIIVRNGSTQVFETYLRYQGGALERIVTYADPAGDAIPETVTVNGAPGSRFGFFVDDTDVVDEGAKGVRMYNIATWDVALDVNQIDDATAAFPWTDSVVTTLTEGRASNEGVSATGADTYTVSAGSLPPGLTLDSATGALTGSPTTAGTYSFTITAENALGQQIRRSFTVTVDPPLPDDVKPILSNGVPTITGDVKPGASLTCTSPTFSQDASRISFAWAVNGASVKTSSTTQAPFRDTFVLPADVKAGSEVTCLVTATTTNAVGSAIAAVSLPVPPASDGTSTGGASTGGSSTGGGASATCTAQVNAARVTSFAPYSTRLSAREAASLRSAFGQGCTGTIVVTGHVEPTADLANDQRLSRQRANALIAVLRPLHPQATFRIRVGGRALADACSASDNRCAITRVTK